MTKQEFLSLQIIFFALIAGPVLFMVAAFISVQNSTTPADPSIAETLLYIPPAMIVGGYIIGSLLFSRMTTKEKIFYADGKVNVNNIRTAYIIRWALLEGANLFTITCFMITNNIYFIYFFIGGLVLYMLTAPKKIWENAI